MKIVSIEPTPSPNTMKLTVDEALPAGTRRTYSSNSPEGVPDYAAKLLAISGVTGVYRAADFIALDRHPKGDWEQILAAARNALGVMDGVGTLEPAPDSGREEGRTGWGEVAVKVQTFRGIPMQVRARAGDGEERIALPERFTRAATEAGMASSHFIRERRLEEYGVRYGELGDVLEEIKRELDAAYDDRRLEELASLAQIGEESPEAPPKPREATAAELSEALGNPDWRIRYAAIERFKPTEETLDLLARALDDGQMSVRRLAAVYLGDVKSPKALPYLFKALKDPSPAVRRTAGDTLSDLGDPAATQAMADALKDSSKLVRWRAARFLFEAGDASAVPALRDALDDPEFEIRLQVQMALERMEAGEAAAGSVWQQMTNRPKS